MYPKKQYLIYYTQGGEGGEGVGWLGRLAPLPLGQISPYFVNYRQRNAHKNLTLAKPLVHFQTVKGLKLPGKTCPSLWMLSHSCYCESQNPLHFAVPVCMCSSLTQYMMSVHPSFVMTWNTVNIPENMLSNDVIPSFGPIKNLWQTNPSSSQGFPFPVASHISGSSGRTGTVKECVVLLRGIWNYCMPHT